MGNSLLCFWIYLDFEIALFTSFVFGLISFFGSIAFSVNNVLTFGAFGCSSFVNNSRDWIDVYNIFLYSNISINNNNNNNNNNLFTYRIIYMYRVFYYLQ